MVTREMSLVEGLKYIAQCLEQGKVYDVSIDDFITGETANLVLARFATKLAADELPHWPHWIELKLKTA